MANTLDLTSLGPLLDKEINTIVRRLALGITVRNTKSSPVDSGRFKNNWFVSVGSASTEVTVNTSKAPKGQSASAAISRASKALSEYDVRSDEVVYVTNNLPYAERLANGYSGQATAGWIDMNIRNEIKSLEVSLGS